MPPSSTVDSAAMAAAKRCRWGPEGSIACRVWLPVIRLMDGSSLNKQHVMCHGRSSVCVKWSDMAPPEEEGHCRRTPLHFHHIALPL
jgi:hypothetical protein